MTGEVIHKEPGLLRVTPNLADDPASWAAYEWSSAGALADGLPDGAGLNMAYECLDRHVAAGRGDHVAVRWIDRDEVTHPITFAALRVESAKFASVLKALDVDAGERVFVLTGRGWARHRAHGGAPHARRRRRRRT